MTWKGLVAEIIGELPREFTLADVLAQRAVLAREFPNNRFIEAKVRQTLQVLRDRGSLRFLGAGRYERLDTPPVFSPLIDFELAAKYVNRAQVARVVLETWATYNLYCLNCERDSLDAMPANAPVADFFCAECRSQYQLKTKNGRFGARIPGAAYGPLVEAARSDTMPEYVIVEYDVRFGTVVFVDAIPGRLITEQRIIPRAKLGARARRAGWQGCNIDLSGLPSVRLVAPSGIDRAAVRPEWRQLSFGKYSRSQ